MTAMFVQEGGKLAGDLIRMAFARSAVKAREDVETGTEAPVERQYSKRQEALEQALIQS